MSFLKKIIVYSFFCCTFNVFSAVNIEKVQLSDDDYVLFSLLINEQKIANSIDSFIVNEQLFLSIEPTLDVLKVRYQLDKNSLKIWKDNEVYEFNLLETLQKSLIGKATWGDDGFYTYISADLLKEIFKAKFSFDTRTLEVNIETTEYLFPFQIIQQQNERRYKDQLSGHYNDQSNNTNHKVNEVEITIPDQYRIATMPMGVFSANTDIDKNTTRYSFDTNLVADFLYHSTILNLTKNENSSLQGGLNFSRYKTSPNDSFLGVFDSYSFGDISTSGSGTSLSRAGLGLRLDGRGKGVRTKNTAITLSEYAPPGWEAELYHNNRFLSTTTVPETGLLLYKDLEIHYGQNVFTIKLYGPYGETDEIKTSYALNSNTLQSGGFAYDAYILDPNKSVFNSNDNKDSLNLSHIGGSIDYGINDTWQLGFSFTHRELDSEQANLRINGEGLIEDAFSFTNSLSFPGHLLENTLAVNGDGGFLQKTSLIGNAVFNGNYSVIYDSSKNYEAGSPDDFDRIQLSYNNKISTFSINTRYRFEDNDRASSHTINNSISTVFKRLYIGHNLSYSNSELKQSNFKTDSLSGTLNIAGMLYPSLRISSSLNYNPDQEDIISDSSTINLTYNHKDPWDMSHYISMQYRPLKKENKWSINHNLSINYDQFRFSLVNRYQDGDQWSIRANLQFFFGYDYHNKKAIFNSKLYRNSAQLNLHAYLDRQVNGVYDPLDYNLEGVQISRLNDWNSLTTGENGRVIIPGVPVNSTFRFDGTWKEGSKMMKNNYVLYTHPGARVDVNMPFYLTSELSGFVSILRRDEEISGNNLIVDLLGAEGVIIESVTTDADGYYEFNNMIPDDYTIRINSKSLRENELSSDVVGFNIVAASLNGYMELPSIFLEKSEEVLKEEVIILAIDNEDIEQLVWDEDEVKMKNYFSMPTKNNIEVDPNEVNTLNIAKLDSKQVLANKKRKVNNIKETTVTLNKEVITNDLSTQLGFTIQFGVYLSLEEAEIFKNKLINKLGVPIQLKENINKNNQSIYRIYYGNYTTRAEAENGVKQLSLTTSEYMIKKTEIKSSTELSPSAAPTSKINSSVSTTVVTPLAQTTTVTPLTQLNSQNMAEETIKNNGWVIQYVAYKTADAVNLNDLNSPPQNIYMAEKVLNDTNYYCLISETFSSKKEAKNALKNNSGWIIPSTTFTNIKRM